MRRVTLLEFRKKAQSILRRARQGERMILTYRGKPVMRLEPINEAEPDSGDPFYNLANLTIEGGVSLTNRQMDSAIYGF